MKQTPISTRFLYLSYVFLCALFFLFCSFTASSQAGKKAFNVKTDYLSYYDTMDITICAGDTLVLNPVLPIGVNSTVPYEYVWKMLPNITSSGTILDSSNKKVDSMELVFTNTTSPSPFYLKIDIGAIIENSFYHYYWAIVRVHTVARPLPPTVNTVPTLHYGESTNLRASSAAVNCDYVWYSNTFNKLIEGVSFNVGPIVQDTTFYVKTKQWYGNASDQYCIGDPSRVDITLLDIMFIPNAFTPNGDGINDIFKIEGAFALSSGTLTVYNQWGAKLFQSSDVNAGWDGRVNGVLQPAGVYVYHFNGILHSGNKKVVQHGSVTLLR